MQKQDKNEKIDIKPFRIAWMRYKLTKNAIYENLMDIQFFKRKSYQQKIKRTIKF